MILVFFVTIVLFIMAIGFMFILGGAQNHHIDMSSRRESFHADPEGYLNTRIPNNVEADQIDMFDPSPDIYNSANMADVELLRLADPVSLSGSLGSDLDNRTFFSDDDLYRYDDDN